jgi:hypothetical protein
MGFGWPLSRRDLRARRKNQIFSPRQRRRTNLPSARLRMQQLSIASRRRRPHIITDVSAPFSEPHERCRSRRPIARSVRRAGCRGDAAAVETRDGSCGHRLVCRRGASLARGAQFRRLEHDRLASPSPRSSRGEGWGEGLFPRIQFAESAPHPKFAAANFDLSPQAGRGGAGGASAESTNSRLALSRRAAALARRGRARYQPFERGGGGDVEPSRRFQFPQRPLDAKPAHLDRAQPLERDLVLHRRH